MLRKIVQRGLRILALGALLVGSAAAPGMAGALAQAPVRPYTGQIREIKVDHCDLQPGTCEGSLVLAQAGGQEVTLAIPARTAIQRGEQRVYLEDLGVGNYITVQATLLATEPPQRLSLEGGVSRDGDRVGATMGERPVTLREATDE
jgi:hypothetical protein